MFVGTGMLLLLAVSLPPGLREEWGRFTVNFFGGVRQRISVDYNSSRNEMRSLNLQFEGHIESTKSHLSTFVVPRCPLLLLFFEQHFRSLALCRGRLQGGTLGTALSIPIPFSRRDDVTFRPAFAWWEEQLVVDV